MSNQTDHSLINTGMTRTAAEISALYARRKHQPPLRLSVHLPEQLSLPTAHGALIPMEMAVTKPKGHARIRPARILIIAAATWREIIIAAAHTLHRD